MSYKQTSKFKRVPSDLYETWDPRAVLPLVPHLPESLTYIEPCCGHGALIRQLDGLGYTCAMASDVTSSRVRDNIVRDATTYDFGVFAGATIVTNPPYQWPILSRILDNTAAVKTVWLLLPADYMHNQRMALYMARCSKVVAVGRLKWIKGSTSDSTKNFAWYCFGPQPCPTVFFGRVQ